MSFRKRERRLSEIYSLKILSGVATLLTEHISACSQVKINGYEDLINLGICCLGSGFDGRGIV